MFDSSRRSAAKKRAGFTLVELLVVIGIIVILFSVILVAIDPARRLQQARDAVRRQDVRDILEAVQEFMADHDGDFPTDLDAVTGSSQVLGTDVSGCDDTCGDTTGDAVTTIAACLDLSGDLVEDYLSDMPLDPKTGTAANTDYAINKTAGNRIELISCDPEIADTITVKR